MKALTKIFAVLLLAALAVCLFVGCREVPDVADGAVGGHDCVPSIGYVLHTRISNYATDLQEAPVVIGSDAEMQAFFSSYLKDENRSRTDWLVRFLASNGENFFDTRSYVLVREPVHDSRDRDFGVCGIEVKQGVLTVTLHCTRDDSQEAKTDIGSSYVLSVRKSDLGSFQSTAVERVER